MSKWNDPLEVDWTDNLTEVDKETGVELTPEVLFVRSSRDGDKDIEYLDNGLISYCLIPEKETFEQTKKKQMLIAWRSKDGYEYAHSGLMSESHRRNLSIYWARRFGLNSPEYKFWMIWLSESPRLYEKLSVE